MVDRKSHDDYFLEMLALVASRSTCQRRAVGAIIVDADHHILATGYNGVPRGFLHCGQSATSKLEIPEWKTVATITMIDRNGKLPLECTGASDASGDTRRCLAVHAEANAILQCQRLDLARTIYVTATPCWECAKLIANTSIQRVVATVEYPTGLDVLRAAGIRIDVRPSPDDRYAVATVPTTP